MSLLLGVGFIILLLDAGASVGARRPAGLDGLLCDSFLFAGWGPIGVSWFAAMLPPGACFDGFVICTFKSFFSGDLSSELLVGSGINEGFACTWLCI